MSDWLLLQTHLCSYAQGKAFITPLTKVFESLTRVYSIQVSEAYDYGIIIMVIFFFSFAVAEYEPPGAVRLG